MVSDSHKAGLVVLVFPTYCHSSRVGPNDLSGAREAKVEGVSDSAALANWEVDRSAGQGRGTRCQDRTMRGRAQRLLLQPPQL